MTYYTGDSVEISAAASDFDGNTVDGSTGTARLSVLEIGGGGAPVKDVEMPFSGPDGAFVFVWDTEGVTEGGYRAVVKVDVGGRQSVETRVINLFEVDPD